MEKQHNNFEEFISGLIGKTDPALVREVIKISNKEQYIFHGIKRNAYFEAVSKEGIKPLTPEGGFASFWTAGYSLFSMRKNVFNPLMTYDTPFFNYAHSTDPAKDKMYMNLAIAKYSELEKQSLTKEPFEENGYFALNKPIPRNLIHLIRIESSNSNSGRESARIAEQMLLKNIYNVLKKDYKKGGLTIETQL
jgi:hypothetical protein